MQKVKIEPGKLLGIRKVDERLVSYNVEMTEVTGGTFWKPYTKEQIEGTEEFPPIADFSDMAGLMKVFEPIDLYNKRLTTLAKALGPVYVRVSGSWATGTYYDFDGHTNGEIPEGYQAVLTKAQWDGVLDFIKSVDAKLLISVANSEGAHRADGTWDETQAKLLFDYSRDYGVPIYAAEFMNEPNTMTLGGTPKGYTLKDFGRDQDFFYHFIRENYPDTLLVGPCACENPQNEDGPLKMVGLNFPPTESLLDECKELADVFSYHSYAGVSERAAAMGGHWDAKDALTEPYLAAASKACTFFGKIRDKYCPNVAMWVTESADAGCGGNTWGSTFMDVIRYADELGSFATLTDGAIFHNTLASSDYGLLDSETFLPRPNYWLALLWNQLVGTNVYDTREPRREGIHMYAHSRRDGKKGYTYVLINNSKEDTTTVEIPVNYECYTLSAEQLRSGQAYLNGKPLEISGECEIPELLPVEEEAGVLELQPATVTFVVI